MSSDSRRSKRHTDFIPITVFVKNSDTGGTLAGPFDGRVVDICSYGACLLMTQVFIDSFHLFHTTREDKSSYFEIRVKRSDDEDEIILTARPVWLNTFQRDDFLERMIGVEFLEMDTQTQTINILRDYDDTDD